MREHPLRVLHLERSEADSRQVIAALEGAGLTCDVVRVDSKAAFAAALDDAFELILAEDEIPELPGLDALELARRRRPNTPFLFVSDTFDADRVLEPLRRGATDVVAKTKLAWLATAVHRALREVEHRTDTARATHWLRFLVEASAVLASSLDVQATLAKVAQLAVPAIADWCIVELVRGEGIDALAEQIAVVHADPQQAELARELRRRYPQDRDASHGADHVLRTGIAELYESVSDKLLRGMARDDEHLELLRRFGWRSVMVVPLVARGETLGAITYATAESRRRYSDLDLEVAQGLADRAAFAVDNARLYTELQCAVRSRDELIAIVSHDLRNPLAAINAGARLVLEGVDPVRVGRIANMIVRSAGRMERLINDLLDLGRIDAHTLAIKSAPLDIEDVLHEAIEANTQLASEKSQQLIALPLPPELDRALTADRHRILQVLQNLVGNAIRFTPEGGCVTLAAECVGDATVISVSDTGPGIAPEQIAHVFERFWRGQPEDNVGMGLGLSIVKGLVEAHGGTVAVASRPGHGATFSFTLPHTPQTPESVVLIVDDDPAIRRAVERALTSANYRVVTAADGVEALDHLRQLRSGTGRATHVQLIILDLMMPRMDGLELRVHLARDPRLAAIPTLVITAYDKLIEGIGPQPAACIQKPFRIKELVSLVERVVGEQPVTPSTMGDSGSSRTSC